MGDPWGQALSQGVTEGGLGKEMFLLSFRTLAVSLAIPLGQGTLTNILGVYESEARTPV